MAVVIAMLSLLVTLPSWSTSAGIRVTLSAPKDIVGIGGVLALQCQVWDIQSHFTINIFRETSTHAEQITNGEDISRPSARLNTFLTKRTFPDRSAVYFLTIADISEGDGGNYLCKVMDLKKLVYIAEDSTQVNIYKPPAKLYPLCVSTPNQPITLNIRDTLKLKCTSEKGMPPVNIRWIDAGSKRQLQSHSIYDQTLINSEVVIQVDESFHDAVFICEITSEGFPEWKRLCTVGPVTIRSYSSDKVNFQNAVGNRDVNSHPTEQCGQCSSTNDMRGHHLTVATVFMALLATFFLVTTIIMCYKYNSISEQTQRRPTRRAVTSQPTVDPVYVSLQRRPQSTYSRRPQSTYSEQEYMTLEDPNNPESKIIVPKETLDDFCKTLTLKRI